MKGRRKSAFKEFLPLATKDSHFYSDIILSKQVGGLVVGSPLCPILANSFLVCHEKKCLEVSPFKNRSFHYRRYVSSI